MKETRSISNISSFAFFGKKEVFQKGNDLYYDNELLFTEVDSFSVKGDLFFVYKSEKDKLVSFQFKEKNRIVYHAFSISPELCFDSSAFLRLNYNHANKSYDYFLYNLLTNEVIQFNNLDSSAVHHFIVYPQVYYKSNNQTSIGCFHLPTETTLWQYSIAELGAEKGSKILGVFGLTLVVVGQIKENTFVLFGLDVQTGQLLWKHDTVFEGNSDGRTLRVKLNLPYADTITNKIIIFEAGHYIEIQGSSGQILKWIDVFKAPFHYNDLTMDAYAFDISQADEDHIYFRTSVPTYGMYTGAGIFNRKTDKLEFLEIIKNEKGNPVIIGPLKIQATKEKYYVLDTQNTLHIFERENESPNPNQ